MAYLGRFIYLIRCYAIVAICFCATLSSMATASTPKDKAEESLYYYNKIRALYPTEGNLEPWYPEITEAYLSQLSIADYRKLLFSDWHYEFGTHVDAILTSYMKKAKKSNSIRDIKVAHLFRAHLPFEDNSNHNDHLIPYLLDDDWFVAFSAYFCKFQNEIYSGDRFLILDSIEQSALLIPSPSDPLYTLVQKIQSESTATLLSMTTNIDAAIQASEASIYFSENGGGHIEYDALILNLIQTHGAIYGDDLTLKLAAELVERTVNLGKDRYYAQNIYGAELLRLRKYKRALPYLLKSVEGLTTSYWLSPTYAEIAEAYLETGEISLAKQYLAKSNSLRSAPESADAHSLSYSVASIKYFARTDQLEKMGDALYNMELSARKTRREMGIALGDQALLQYQKTNSYGININGQKYDFLMSTDDETTNRMPTRVSASLSENDRYQLDLISNLVFLKTAKKQNLTESTAPVYQFLDAFMSTKNSVEVRAAFNRLRNASQTTTAYSKALIPIFDLATTTLELPFTGNGDGSLSRYDLFMQSIEQQETFQSISPQLKIHVHILAAKFAILDRDYKNAWYAILTAESLLDSADKESNFSKFDLEMMKASLYAIEHNYSGTLGAMVETIKAGLLYNRTLNIDQILSYGISSLQANGLLTEALEIAQMQMQVNSKSLSQNSYMGKYNYGVLLSAAGELNTAISYLKQSSSTTASTRRLIQTRRELYKAYAGLNDHEMAATMRTSLQALMSSQNDPILIRATNIDLALGDYLLADFQRSENSEELYKKWVSLKQSESKAIRAAVDQIVMSRTQALGEVFSDNKKTVTQLKASRQAMSQVMILLAVLLIFLLFAGLTALFVTRRKINSAVAEVRVKDNYERMKSHYLRLINHHSQLTLNTISRYAETLKKVYAPMQDEPTIDMIRANADRLSKDISDYVFSARILSGERELIFEPFEIREYQTRKSEEVKARIDSNNVNFFFESENVPPRFLTDKMLLKSILDNAIDLAIDRTELGFVKVAFSYQKSLDADQLQIQIEDTGPGLSDHLEEISTDILSLNQETIVPIGDPQQTSTAIIWSAVKTLKGTISFSAQPGEGTRMIANIPIVLDEIEPLPVSDNDNKVVRMRS